MQIEAQTLTSAENKVLSHLMQGFKASKIAEILKLSYHTVKKLIQQLKEAFLNYFRLEEFAYP